ncbi:hypothetical protein MCOR27_011772 [Pyricularia oryzae]|nr:hypothetical protein MCOR19_011668 [Pyricularia oryzae]KAI6264211.1 hypothetical protein MCOR27_011772 [Pyricularia oryzae]KAI6276441.1 hypothetical protein MCOR34_011388 [Pyricularia oryzae]KAI6330458.1 hypothetical protein MCOR28_011666 [Pyricularia oryzae]KAI6351522.1 hypothetical protein MCOR32_011625 [Pyricularia oryzae]
MLLIQVKLRTYPGRQYSRAKIIVEGASAKHGLMERSAATPIPNVVCMNKTVRHPCHDTNGVRGTGVESVLVECSKKD